MESMEDFELGKEYVCVRAGQQIINELNISCISASAGTVLLSAGTCGMLQLQKRHLGVPMFWQPEDFKEVRK